MKNQTIQAALTSAVFLVIFFLGNNFFLNNSAFSANFKEYQFSLEFIYLLFFVFSIVIVLLLLFVNQKSKDNVGMTFMLATTVKAIVCYIVFSKIITSENQNTVERINFFVLFILFLIIETLITIRLLNKKQ